MATEPVDAWKTIKPLAQLAEHLTDLPSTGAVSASGMAGLSLFVGGLEAIFVADGGDDRVEARFRYRPGAGAWQLFRPRGTGWIADGPPSPRIDRLLERIVLVMLGGDPAPLFAEES